jgi:hypothetical protein
MDSYSVLHLPGDAVYSAYTYYQIYVAGNGTLTYKGITLPPPTNGPMILNLIVNSPTDAVGSNIAFLGKKKPEEFHRGPAGQNGLNTDGTWSIR